MNPKINPNRKYNGMVISNLKDSFKAVSDSLDKVEEVEVSSLPGFDQLVSAASNCNIAYSVIGFHLSHLLSIPLT